MPNTIETLKRQINEVHKWMSKERAAGNSLSKIEKFEKDFLVWKKANGFHANEDCEGVVGEIEYQMAQL